MTTRRRQINLATVSRLHSVPANDLLAIFMSFDDGNPQKRREGGKRELGGLPASLQVAPNSRESRPSCTYLILYLRLQIFHFAALLKSLGFS